jgi:hypothetical protein
MTAKQKIEALTRSWYGYSVFAALVSVLAVRASGPLSLMIGLGLSVALNLVALVISVAIITFFGRKLLHKSNGTRIFLVVVSGLGTVLSVLGVTTSAWQFLHEWSLAAICSIVLGIGCVMLNARSFKVLTETGVRAYFV